MPLFRCPKRRRVHAWKGFTLIELLVVIAILGVLAAIVMIAINPSKQLAESRNTVRRQDVKQLANAVEQYTIDNGLLPTGVDTTLRMIGMDAAGCAVACGSELGPETGVSVRVSASADDAEEEVATDDLVYVTSTDLEMVQDYDPARGNQLIGMRFQNITVPVGATIASASIQFTASLIDGNGNEATNLVFVGQDSDDAAAFTTAANNISTRPRTTATVAWSSVPNWTVDGGTHDSPNIATVLQEIVDRSGWQSGNDIVVMVEGTGRRPAYSYNEGNGSAPLLSLTYQVAGLTAGACLSLTGALVPTFVTGLPLDPTLGSAAKTYYAVKRDSSSRILVSACGAELEEIIEVRL